MRVLIVYYTLTGNTRRAAELLAEALDGGDDTVIRPIVTSRRFTFLEVLNAPFGGTVAIRPLDVPVAGFDAICLGSPVWAASPVPAVNAFIDDLEFNGTVHVFVTGAFNSPSAVNRMKSRLKRRGIKAGASASLVVRSKTRLDREKVKEYAKAIKEG